MREDSDYVNNDYDDETYTLTSKHKKHKKLVKKINNDSESELNVEIKKNNEIQNKKNIENQ